jgi:hypothetical protein
MMRMPLTVALAAIVALSATAPALAGQTAPQRPVATAGDGAGPPVTNQSGWAVVNRDGVLLHSLNAKKATRLSTGSYLVTFNSKLLDCSTVATIGSPAGNDIGVIVLQPAAGDAKALFVTTIGLNGQAVDDGFNLLVTC